MRVHGTKQAGEVGGLQRRTQGRTCEEDAGNGFEPLVCHREAGPRVSGDDVRLRQRLVFDTEPPAALGCCSLRPGREGYILALGKQWKWCYQLASVGRCVFFRDRQQFPGWGNTATCAFSCIFAKYEIKFARRRCNRVSNISISEFT